MRRCNHCGFEKPLTLAYFGKGGPSNKGFQPYCLTCSPEVQGPYHKDYKKKKAQTKIKELQNMGQMFFFNAGAF